MENGLLQYKNKDIDAPMLISISSNNNNMTLIIYATADSL